MEPLCKACERDNKRCGTAGFCIDCGEYLCERCCSFHLKIKTLQNHEILDKEEALNRGDTEIMQLAQSAMEKASSKQCVDHIGKTLEYFCTCCNVMACPECVSQDHKECNTVHFPIVSSFVDATQPEGEKILKENIEAISKGLAGIRPRMQANMSEVKKKRQELSAGLEEFKKDIIANIEVLFADIDKHAEKIAKEDELHCDAIIRKSVRFLDHLKKQTKAETKDGKEADLFQAATRTSALLQTLPEAQKSESGKIRSHRHCLESLTRIQDFVEAIYMFVSETKQLAVPESQLTNMSTETEEDTEQCQISGAMVTGTRLVIADRGNKKVKVFDTVNTEMITELELPSLFQDS